MTHQGRVLLVVLIAAAIGCHGGICEEGATRCIDDPQHVGLPPGVFHETCVTIDGDASAAFWALDDCVSQGGVLDYYNPPCPGSNTYCRNVGGDAQTGYGLCYCH